MKTQKEILATFIKEYGYSFASASASVDIEVAFKNALRDLDLLMPKEICICSAVIAEDGSVYRGHRHSDCFDTLIRNRKKPKSGMEHQGFITSRNRYVGREEGKDLQNKAGIKSVWIDGYVKEMLFSEDLY